MRLPFANLGAKFHPDSFNVHRIETLCLQHTLVRLLLILCEPRLSRLTTLPCYVPPMKPDSSSSLKSSCNLKPGLHKAICLTGSFVFRRGYCVNF